MASENAKVNARRGVDDVYKEAITCREWPG